MYAVDTQSDFTLGVQVGRQVYQEAPHLDARGVSNVARHRWENASKSMTLDQRLFERGVRFGYREALAEANAQAKRQKETKHD